MPARRKAKQLTYSQVVGEIEDIKVLMKKAESGCMTLPQGFSYREAQARLHYLRNRQTQLKKKAKGGN